MVLCRQQKTACLRMNHMHHPYRLYMRGWRTPGFLPCMACMLHMHERVKNTRFDCLVPCIYPLAHKINSHTHPPECIRTLHVPAGCMQRLRQRLEGQKDSDDLLLPDLESQLQIYQRPHIKVGTCINLCSSWFVSAFGHLIYISAINGSK